ncbi:MULTISPECIES: hypothetical protein [Vibrio]|uniref:hypothetical protein n=1 Tax=Vibrio TaxID=662 RepID=UPI001EFC565A|nr:MULTISPECIES: hypothetical protein [Vibrio]MCG9678944.1 hypothetical protein [Vibrio sp. Isolate24]USD33965.1 hypothetical protein J8Z27_07735 [Vibrio sp. SCSIO 43186]USD44235.1 hypothetical protein J4N38_08120 [Vibrio sp. SCSIO 43145]USD71088.1 hypothetical protein J4N41_07735 [Vibrio sp. SCSIO 43139]USD95994.1 hypothetical protein CTT30_07840 [Vibrio coralliilyticus]
METMPLPDSKAIACEDHLIIWFWETHLHKKGLAQNVILAELKKLGDLLVSLRQDTAHFLLPSSRLELVVDIVPHTLLLGDKFYEEHYYFVQEIRDLIDKQDQSQLLFEYA